MATGFVYFLPCLLTRLSLQCGCVFEKLSVFLHHLIFLPMLFRLFLPFHLSCLVLLSLLVNQGEKEQSLALTTSLMRTLFQLSGLRLLRSAALPPATDQFRRSRGFALPACPLQSPWKLFPFWYPSSWDTVN